jgi:hypothetical protein
VHDGFERFEELPLAEREGYFEKKNLSQHGSAGTAPEKTDDA